MSGGSPLRIAYITHQAMPSTDTAGIQIIQTTSALVRAGAVVDLLLPVAPWAPTRSVAAPVLRERLRQQYHTDCGFRPVAIRSKLGPSFLAHALHARLALAAALALPQDLVYSRDERPLWPALRAGRPTLFESYRPPPADPSRRSRLQAIVAHERFLGLITHSEYARQRYLDAGFPAGKIRTIYNGFDPAPFREGRTPAEARRALGWPEQATVVYAGRIAPMKRIDLLLEGARRTPDLRWVLAGDIHAPEARALVAEAGAMPNVSLTGYLSGARLGLALQGADILVIPPSADPLNRYGKTVLPIKLFQYLAAGRAIVAGDLPDTAELLTHDQNSVRIRPDDAAALAAAVSSLVADPARRDRLGARARERSATLTWDARAGRILEFIRERLAMMQAATR